MNGNIHRLFILLTAFTLVSSRVPSHADDTPELAKIKIAAVAGGPVAQFKLAQHCGDPKQADAWYRKSAEQGYAPAQGQLGFRLFLRYGMTLGLKPEQKAALGEEALKWLTLGANQGDTLAQGNLARVYLEGKLVSQDLIQAYKWGALAAKGSSFNVGTTFGRQARDAAILKMTAAQIAEGEKQVAAFTPHAAAPPKPALPSALKLKGISGTPERRFAMINNKTFAPGETQAIKLPDKTVSVRCVEIRDTSVLITLEGFDGTQELRLN